MISLHKRVPKTFQKLGYFSELGPREEGGMGWDGMGWNGMGCDVMGCERMGWTGMG